EDIAGTYRAARREALRTQLLGDARARLREVEQRGGDKIVPTLLLRIHQAISRAEAQLAQENIESARLNADEALAWADHARAMILYIEQAQKAKTPWEAALLPYDDMLLVIASYLDGTLDLSEGGSASGPQLIALIDAQSDSLKTVIAAQDSLHAALEDSIEVLQSLLTEVQNRIADLEGGSADSDSGGTSISPDELARRITRAQEAFKPGEAIVVQNPDGTVVIRLTDLQFATGATKLNKIHQRILERAIVAIAQFKNAKVRVEGHTDNSGGADINEMLSNSRAQQVADFIAKRMRLPDEQIESVGLGETQPIASNETADGRARNRRIDIVLTLP
ncbi:MAG: OmpA family protein, partial [Calditrichota bacterium]